MAQGLLKHSLFSLLRLQLSKGMTSWILHSAVTMSGVSKLILFYLQVLKGIFIPSCKFPDNILIQCNEIPLQPLVSHRGTQEFHQLKAKEKNVLSLLWSANLLLEHISLTTKILLWLWNVSSHLQRDWPPTLISMGLTRKPGLYWEEGSTGKCIPNPPFLL